jgi:hypothetical protein
MKLHIATLLIGVSLMTTFTTPAMADGNFGLQVFSESSHDQVTVTGANLIFGSLDYDNDAFGYAGIGFKNVKGYSHDIDGSYAQMVVGFSMPWLISPYVEIAIDPIDMLIEEFDDNDDGINASFGIGARLSLNNHLSLDIGVKYHHFSDDTDNFTGYEHAYHSHHPTDGIGTAAVSLNLSF